MKSVKEFLSLHSIQTDTYELYTAAFTHPSYLNENPADGVSYQRLEFLGDAILSLVASVHLYTTLKNAPEGYLTDIRAALVRTESLAQAALSLNMHDYIRFSKGEMQSGPQNIHILADVFEAFLGALYLDKGYSSVELFFMKYLAPRIPHIIEGKTYLDSKTILQEFIQTKTKRPPQYRLLRELDEGFIIEVVINNKVVATGTGRSKKLAEQDGAKNAIAKLMKE